MGVTMKINFSICKPVLVWHILIVLSLTLIFARPALAAQDPWPKRFEDPKGTVVMYQPQVEDFQG